jgi:ADP-heptose:LPS heptosyltransferase
VLCRAASSAVYQLLAHPPIIHAWEPPWGDDQPFDLWQALAAARRKGRTLRMLSFDAAVCAWADARVEILMAETRATRRVGFPMTRGNYYAAKLPWRQRRRFFGRALEILWRALHPNTPLLTQWLHRESPRQPHFRCWQQIAEALDVPYDVSVPWIAAKDNTAQQRGPRPVLAVHAHARLPSKQWPLHRWRELAAATPLTEKFEIVEILPEGADPVTPDKVRKISTPSLVSLVTALQGADAVVCHDSFPAHLAAALGKPVVTIFGSGEPDWFAPWNNRDHVVQRRVCPLHPCIDRCGMDSYLCLDTVASGDVLTQLERLSLIP